MSQPIAAARLPLLSRLSRMQAFALHLTLSLLVFSTLVFTMLMWWFPGELFLLDGGWQGLKLVAMVDLVLGPALTLILFAPNKPKLLLDLSIIAVIQLAALGYGFYATYQQRTVAIVHADGQFNTVSAQAVQEANQELAERDREPRSLDAIADHPLPLLLTPPPGRDEFGEYLVELLNGFPEPHERTDQYVALDTRMDVVNNSALDPGDLGSEQMRDRVTSQLDALGLDEDEVQLHRFRTRYAKGVALFDPRRKAIIDYLPEEAFDTEVLAGESGSSD